MRAGEAAAEARDIKKCELAARSLEIALDQADDAKVDRESLRHPQLIHSSMGALGKVIRAYPAAWTALQPFANHAPGTDYPSAEFMNELRRAGGELEAALALATTVVAPPFIEKDVQLMASMHAIYRAYDAAVEALHTTHQAASQGLLAFQKKHVTKGLLGKVEALEAAVVAARAANVEHDVIKDVLITLTVARANMRVLKDHKEKHAHEDAER